ncbi:MAG: hypothetical protein WCV00_01280 [Verrucomicrobiia bacterium]|jgi:hypothetical protein
MISWQAVEHKTKRISIKEQTTALSAEHLPRRSEPDLIQPELAKKN